MSKKLYNFDVVGSLLRPTNLREATKAYYDDHSISLEELTKVQDEAIKTLVDKQVEAGLPVVTDGEFRRLLWHTDFFWGFENVNYIKLAHGYKFHNHESRTESCVLVGKIGAENHPFVDHFKFVKAYVDEKGYDVLVKQTVPSPSQFLSELLREEHLKTTLSYYTDVEEVKTALVDAYRKVIQDLYDAGARIIQFDDVTWSYFLGGPRSEVSDGFYEDSLELNNRVYENWPEDLTFNTHVCRGNNESDWALEGAYDNAAEYLFQLKIDNFYLEYDDERSGGFEPLRNACTDQNVVLGLITTKTGKLESKEDIKARIDEATRYVAKENIILSPQCGFASTEEGNHITEEDQWNKIRLVKEIAEEYLK